MSAYVEGSQIIFDIGDNVSRAWSRRQVVNLIAELDADDPLRDLLVAAVAELDAAA